ncbi:hypothetical protein M9H77_30752 [Catharanthus roseus]|uniref:Uncharacterized protein n=1 Tax=Catharanthus roseus TaxID=4058 RepID=A0ACB9ZZ77_CATRO|nr:hypothetical protein M9H77_30752 [Catharanthus roseus]
MPSFSLGLTPLVQSHLGGTGTSYAPSPPSLGFSSFRSPYPPGLWFSSFQAPHPPGTESSSFQAPPPPGLGLGSSTPHMPISHAASSDSDEHDDERMDDLTPAQQLGFGHRIGKRTTSKNNDNKIRYLWTIVPNLVKERIHVLVEFIPIQRQIVLITHDTNTTNMTEHVTAITHMVPDEPSILYPTIYDDDDADDYSNEDYAVSSKSESNDNNDTEEEELRTHINPVTKNIVTQWESSQRFNRARYDYTQSGDFLDMGLGSPINELVESGTLRLLEWNDSMTGI